MGASHGIGHQLGPLGVGHGETSCSLLPAVCAYNHSVNAKHQEKVKDVLLADVEVAQFLVARSAGFRPWSIARRLHFGVRHAQEPQSRGIGKDKLEMLAQNSLRDRWCETNPRPLRTKGEVLKILEMVQG